ncbi:MAG TPA: hypothetical protein VF881_11285 [Polyangiaceae bacterium]
MRRTLSIVLVLLVPLACGVAACGGDDTAGTPGTGGAGTGGKGGSSGGKGGSAGSSAATGGSGGSSGGGTGGSTAGSGGSTAGTGGMDASAGSAGADASTDGRADTASADVRTENASDAAPDTTSDVQSELSDAAAVAKVCIETCASDGDCVPKALSDKFPYSCDTTKHRCVLCKDDIACYAQVSLWSKGCRTKVDCTIFGDVCVNVNGAGRCAYLKGSPNCELDGGGQLETFWVQTFELDAGSESVEVCGKKSSTCDLATGTCFQRCTTASCASDPAGKVCNDATGKCECGTDSNCSGLSGVSVCNTATKHCECAGNQDCRALDGGLMLNADICVAGKCSCSSVTVCTQKFKTTTTTTLSCE